MLDRLSARAGRAVLAATSIAALSLTGCNLVSGPHDAATEFLVSPGGSSNFYGWSEITISQDASSVKGASLQFARLEVPDDSPADDLTFIQNILGELVILGPDGERAESTPAAKKDQMPKDETTVLLDRLYDGDLRHWFPDGHTIRIEWTGQKNPAVEIPPEGLWVDVRVRVLVE